MSEQDCEQLTLFQEDSHASLLALPGSEKARKMTVTSGRKCSVDEVLSSLEGIGYDCATFHIPACGVDAPHKRFRIAILAHTDDRSRIVRRDGKFPTATETERKRNDHGGRTAANVTGERRSVKPGLGGVADGLSYWMDEPAGIQRLTTLKKNRADRLKCLGNAVVPQQFYPFFAAIAEIERRSE